MTTENDGLETLKKESKPSQSDIAFGKLSSIEPELEVSLLDEGEEGGIGHKTLAEKMEESPNLSDIQSLDKGLFPDTGFKHLNMIEVSMVTPERFLAYESLLVKDLISNHDELSVTEAIVYADTVLNIGFDREGRIDKLSLGGAVREDELLKKEEKKLGLGM